MGKRYTVVAIDTDALSYSHPKADKPVDDKLIGLKVRARATSWVDGTSLGGHSAGVPVPVDGGPHTGHGRLRYAGTHEKHSGYLVE